MRSRKQIALIVAGGLSIFLALGTIGYFLAIHNLDEAFRNADFKPFDVIFKKAATDIIVLKQSPKEPSQTHGYLEAYKNNPAAFQSDARLFDAWMASVQIGEATFKNTLAGEWVRSTADAAYLPSANRVDSWGHSFCLLRRGDTLVVVSAGPKAQTSPICRDIRIGVNEFADVPRMKLIETPAGNLILMLDKRRPELSTSSR